MTVKVKPEPLPQVLGYRKISTALSELRPDVGTAESWEYVGEDGALLKFSRISMFPLSEADEELGGDVNEFEHQFQIYVGGFHFGWDTKEEVRTRLQGIPAFLTTEGAELELWNYSLRDDEGGGIPVQYKGILRNKGDAVELTFFVIAHDETIEEATKIPFGPASQMFTDIFNRYQV